MSTALTIIEDALREIGVLAEGEAASAAQSSDGLRVLNRLLERWSNQRLMLYVETQLSYTLTGAGSFTVGESGADLTAARPIKVLSAYAELASIHYPVDVLTAEQWDGISLNTSGGAPTELYYQAAMPNGTVYVHNDTAGYALKMRVQTALTSFASLSTSASLPPGYEDALVLDLAVRMAPSYGLSASADTKREAVLAKRVLKRVNLQVPTLNGPSSGAGARSWFESGGF